MRTFEQFLESAPWRSRFVVLFAVIASVAAAFVVIYIASVDVLYLLRHISHHADPALDTEGRKVLHDATVTHVVEGVDGDLLGTSRLIFALGLYQLFGSDIDAAKGSKAPNSMLVIETLEDQSQQLAKVILMVLIVAIFELARKLEVGDTLELLHPAGALVPIGLALNLSHAADGRQNTVRHPAQPPEPTSSSLSDLNEHTSRVAERGQICTFLRHIVGLCNEKSGKYGRALPPAQSIGLESDRRLGTECRGPGSQTSCS